MTEDQISRPSDLGQILVFVSEDVLEIPSSDFQVVREVVSRIGFEDAMAGLAYVAAFTFDAIRDSERQLEFARSTYASPFIERIQTFFAEHPNAELFPEQSVAVLQRFVIEYAGEESAVSPEQEQATLAFSVVACGTLSSMVNKGLESDTANSVEWLAYFIQNAMYNRKRNDFHELVRVAWLYTRVARTDELRAHNKWVDLDQWMQEEYGFSIDEQLAFGFALATISGAMVSGDEVGTKSRVSEENFQDLLVKLQWQGRAAEARSLISAARASLREGFSVSTDVKFRIWDRRPFLRSPFLSFPDDGLLLISPRYIRSWLTEGIHYRLLDAAQVRNRGDKKRRASRDFTDFEGAIYEKYALELVTGAYGTLGMEHCVYPEQPYGKGDGAFTSDIAIVLGKDLVLIEITASRISYETAVLGKPENVLNDLDRVVVKKAKQVSNCIDALRAKTATIPAGRDANEIEHVTRIWPIVASPESVPQFSPVWTHLRAMLGDTLKQEEVQPLTLLSMEDLEVLMGMVESGEDLITILEAKTQPSFREREFMAWLKALGRETSPMRTKRSEEIWEEMTDLHSGYFDFSAGIQPSPDEAS